MSNFTDKTRKELVGLESDLKAAVNYFTRKLDESQKDLEGVTEALKAFTDKTVEEVKALADQAVEEVKAVTETVKEEVKKAAPKRSTKKAAERADSSEDSDK